MTNSTASSSIRATHYKATRRYIRIHTRTSCSVQYNSYNLSGVQYNSYNLSGPGTLLWNRTRNDRKRKSGDSTQTSSISASSTVYAHETDFSIAQTTLQSSMIVHIWKMEQNNEKMSQKKTWRSGLEPQTPSANGGILSVHVRSIVHDNFLECHACEWMFG